MINSKTKQRIVSTFSKYNNKDIELEARFGYFRENRFTSGVTRQVFNRILEYFGNLGKPTVIKTTDYIGDNNVRKSVVTPTNSNTPQSVIWMTKTRLWNWDDRDYNVRYSMSQETLIEPIPNFISKVIREKNRYTFIVFSGSVKVDLTIVDMITSKGNKVKDKSVYEVEVELIQNNRLDYFEKSLQVVLYRVLDTIVLYTNRERDELISYVNNILDSTSRHIIGHYPLVQARDLKMKDMVYGGLIGNPVTGYSVTHKADGSRKMLVFNRLGIWLVMAPKSVNRVSNQTIPTLIGSILDGEMVPDDKRLSGAPKSKIWYLTFDCLAYGGDNSVQDKPHFNRMQYAQEVANHLKSDLIQVNTKSFRNFTTPQEFFLVMRDMFREETVLSYKQDGLMFTPSNTEYNPHTDKVPLKRRVLTSHPDICKWKPQDRLTIDFLIKWQALPTGQREIKLYTNLKGKPVLFRGTKSFPYSGQVDSLSPVTYDLPDNTVVEYGWDYEREILIPHVVRHDKTKPNKLDIAEDVWVDIHIPISEETLKGNTFTFLRKYHNRIKQDLFIKASGIKPRKKISDSDKKNLLDIGSGFGGDISKWKNYNRIVAVEPNPEHIKELQKRIESYNMKDRVRIVQAGGQDTLAISKAVREFLGDRADVISLMFSLTFFWQSTDLVNNLIDTMMMNIKKNGEIIYATMDGDTVEQVFEPAFDNGPPLTKLELGVATLEYLGDKNPKELKINIKDSIVRDQTEWLVRLEDLKIRLSRYGFDIITRERADNERFLTEEEITMTQMYSYGTIKRVVDTGPLPEPVIVQEPVGTPMIGLPPIPGMIMTPLVQPIPEIPALQPLESLTEQISLLNITVPPHVTSKEIENELPGILPDTYESVAVSWYPSPPNEEVVRIGAIGDGSCFFHSVLNGYYKEYQNNPDRRYRIDLVKKLRRDIGFSLQEGDPNYVGKIRWETAAGGQLAGMYEQQQLGVDFESVFGYPIDFSLNGLQRLINSNEFLGNEVYSYAADMLNIDIFITRLTEKDLYVHQNTNRPGSVRRVVVISGNGDHYETIGLIRNSLFQTFFEYDDPFIMALKSQVSEDYLPIQVTEEKLSDGLQILREMGFTDEAFNKEVLIQHGLDVESAANVLSGNNNL